MVQYVSIGIEHRPCGSVWECDNLNSMCVAEFAADDRNVEVNEGDSQSTLTLTVERVGGAVGVVQVQWNLTTSSGMAL